MANKGSEQRNETEYFAKDAREEELARVRPKYAPRGEVAACSAPHDSGGFGRPAARRSAATRSPQTKDATTQAAGSAQLTVATRTACLDTRGKACRELERMRRDPDPKETG